MAVKMYEIVAACAIGIAAVIVGLFASFANSSSVLEQVQHVLLVIAHPDDESMFFVPSLLAFQRNGARISVLCLTKGEGGGNPEVRSKELERAAAGFGITPSDVICLQDTALPDSMTAVWDINRVKQIVEQHVVTFDESGISGHRNHISVFKGVAQFAAAHPETPCYKLLTVPLWRKFTSVLDMPLTALLYKGHASTSTGLSNRMLFVNSNPAINNAAMAAHASQYVWFRKLFVYFSRYVFMNDLQRIDSDGLTRTPSRSVL